MVELTVRFSCAMQACRLDIKCMENVATSAEKKNVFAVNVAIIIRLTVTGKLLIGHFVAGVSNFVGNKSKKTPREQYCVTND
jgi:hypothetical protein